VPWCNYHAYITNRETSGDLTPKQIYICPSNFIRIQNICRENKCIQRFGLRASGRRQLGRPTRISKGIMSTGRREMYYVVEIRIYLIGMRYKAELL
jgi:hypothetical protein